MTHQTRNILIGLVIVIIVLILGYFAWQERGTSIPATATSTAATSTDISANISSTTTSGPGYTIKPVTGPSITAPSTATPLVFSASVSVDERATLQSQFAQAQATLKASPTDFNAWVALGGLRKEAGDYAGAAIDWQYVSALYPTNVVSFANLADLYTNFLPDYPKAAAAYKQAIKNDPKRADLYMSLFSLYTNQYPQSAATAEAVLQQGIAANPNAADLKAALASYQAAHGGQ